MSSPSQAAPAAAPDSQPYNTFWGQSQQFTAAKYATFIFFGLSVFVVCLFAAFLVCHLFRRFRAMRSNSRPVQLQAIQVVGLAPERPLPLAPIKQGFVVNHPDGGVEVAIMSEVQPSPCKASAAFAKDDDSEDSYWLGDSTASSSTSSPPCQRGSGPQEDHTEEQHATPVTVNHQP
ncbi:hypothetical protein WJX72_009281 [[Myrmecia] bisecta]|uniref:Uncharacterized protein n=1 Tax=[Myrmecia] bisecta TaxID=41462 RepID=A0AAW1QAY2_9CHLO